MQPPESLLVNISAAVEDPVAPSLIQRLAALPEPAMRAASLTQELLACSAEAGTAFIDTLMRRARIADDAALTAYACLVDPDAVGGPLGEARVAAMVEVAEASGHVLAHQWLQTTRDVSRGDTVDGDRLIHRDLRKLTLGDRRAMARRARGDGLKRLLMDPDPGVIINVLNNPHTTEEVVVGIAARRPTVAAPLLCVLRAPRWARRYRVKLALVYNPTMPTRYGINLLVYLTEPDLGRVRDAQTLAPSLRLAAQRILGVGRLGEAAGA